MTPFTPSLFSYFRATGTQYREWGSFFVLSFCPSMWIWNKLQEVQWGGETIERDTDTECWVRVRWWERRWLRRIKRRWRRECLCDDDQREHLFSSSGCIVSSFPFWVKMRWMDSLVFAPLSLVRSTSTSLSLLFMLLSVFLQSPSASF